MKPPFLSALSVLITAMILAGCASNEIGDSKDVNQETIYQQYNISYGEADGNVKITAQFRFAGENGTTLVLAPPGGITLDGEMLKVDSSEITGAYYEMLRPANIFFGKHQLIFTDVNKKLYTNNFTFDVFKPVTVPLVAYKNQSLHIGFDRLLKRSDYYIEVNAENTDSVFTITNSTTDSASFIEIPASELKRQTAKELSLSFSLVKKLSLQNSTKEGWIILIEYHLKPVTIKLEEAVPVSSVVPGVHALEQHLELLIYKPPTLII